MLHENLQLQHHRHTGRLIHHRHTSYRGLAVLLVLAGVFIVGLSIMQRAAADSLFSVGATVRAPLPPLPASIGLPGDGDTVTAGDVPVAGGCPLVTPQPIVAIELDGKTVGSAICDGTNDYSLPVSLSAGAHELTTQTFTIDGRAGPIGKPIHITANSAAKPLANTPAFTLASATPFASLSGDTTATWDGALTGPQAHYVLSVSWGDGQQNTYSLGAGEHQFSHHYASLASYNALFILEDGSGAYQQQQYAVAAYTAPSLASSNALVSDNTIHPSTTVGLYGLFITLVCVFFIVRLHAAPFAFTEITLVHHGKK